MHAATQLKIFSDFAQVYIYQLRKYQVWDAVRQALLKLKRSIVYPAKYSTKTSILF